MLADVGDVVAIDVSDVVDVASVVVAVKAETMPVLRMPITKRLIIRTLTVENIIVLVFIQRRLLIIILSRD